MALLYVVATPIGNLGDLTFRAADTLRSLDYIACEDTRHTRILTDSIGCKARLLRCDAVKARQCIPGIVNLLDQGHSVGYVTDAGTPGISDPGQSLVTAVRKAGFAVVPIPGVSAVTTLMSVAGVGGSGWSFAGFLPVKAGRRTKRLKTLAERNEPFVVYEGPHRIGRLLQQLAEMMPTAQLFIGREMTKAHEEYISGTTDDLARKFAGNELILKGEFTILVSPKENS